MALRGNIPSALAFLPPDPWPGNAATGRAIIAGQFHTSGFSFFTAYTKTLWHVDAGMGEAPLAALHSFSFLHDLRAAGGDDARIMARSLVSSWIDAHGGWQERTWRPDILARRISVWISLHDFYCASADDAFRSQVFLSLSQQLRHLSRAAADCPPGIATLSVIKALCYGGLCFPAEEARLVQGLRLLEGELRTQILPDGGHVSRDPEQLLTALIDLIDIRTALRAAKRPVPETLGHAIERMVPALRFFRHGDGGLALFNGANEGMPMLIDMALAQADIRGRPLRSATASHFERISLGKTLLLVDTGAPPRIPAASGAHAGTFSFEMSIGRQRLITNCGSTSLPGEWPLVLRGTAAHSTLIMADINSSSIMPGTRKPASTQVRREDADGIITLEGSHDGYKRPLGMIHTRKIILENSGETLSGEDTLEGPIGQPFTIRFHLHPDVIASSLTGGDVLLRLPSGMGWRFHSEGVTAEIEDSVYFGAPDSPRKTHQITLSGTTGHKETKTFWRLSHEARKPKTEAGE
ncbi:MAG: hypothetical protein A2018_03470 [Alphaproteobacteria bacterium GWF2_58_20]|nr:MAG: hypothetical protein A2018_03470 [Alphaproteobacteria bacterium GWF2_58_20]